MDTDKKQNEQPRDYGFLYNAAAEAESLGTWINVVTDDSHLPSYIDEAARKKLHAENTKAWYDARSGGVIAYAPHCATEEDALRVVWRETVAKQGLPALLGRERYDKLCEDVYANMTRPEQLRTQMSAFYKLPKEEMERIFGQKPPTSVADLTAAQRAAFLGDAGVKRLIGEKYLAQCAETGEFRNPKVWEVIRSLFRHLARKLGFDVAVRDEDIKAYLAMGYDKLKSDHSRGERARQHNPMEAQQSASASVVVTNTVPAPVIQTTVVEEKKGEEEKEVVAEEKQSGEIKEEVSAPVRVTPSPLILPTLVDGVPLLVAEYERKKQDQNPDTVLLLGCGKEYRLYQSDAERAGKILSMPTTRGEGMDSDGKPVTMLTISADRFNEIAQRLSMAGCQAFFCPSENYRDTSAEELPIEALENEARDEKQSQEETRSSGRGR